MTTSGSGGYLLHAIRMCVFLQYISPQTSKEHCRYDNPNVSAVVLKHPRSKKRKTESSTPVPEVQGKDDEQDSTRMAEEIPSS